MSVVGILGAGKLGTVLARLAVAAGYDTRVAGSGDPDGIRMIVDILAPGATTGWAAEIARDADIVILAIPLSKLHTLPAAELAGKVVVDATNYWPPTDGTVDRFAATASSPLVAAALPGTRVVKALSHLGYHELDTDTRPASASDRRAIAIASDDAGAVATVASLVDRLGFDPHVLPGGLSAGAGFGPGTPAFGASVDRETLAKLVAQGTRGTLVVTVEGR